MSEVRDYVKRLVALILLGILLMAGTAVWAWNKYGKRVSEAPPLPSGTPPMAAPPSSP